MDELKSDMKQTLKALGDGALVHVMQGVNSDSGHAFDRRVLCRQEDPNLPEDVTLCDTVLYEVVAECRTVKTAMELQLYSYCLWVSSQAHVDVMRATKPLMMEHQLESLFKYRIAQGGCRQAAYTPICASGPNGAVLHYGHVGAPNDRQIQEVFIMSM